MECAWPRRYLIVRAVVKLGGTGTLMRCHCLGVFERAAIVEICSNAGRAESVIADWGGNVGVTGAALQHAPGVGLSHWAIGQNTSAPAVRKSGPSRSSAMAATSI